MGFLDDAERVRHGDLCGNARWTAPATAAVGPSVTGLTDDVRLLRRALEGDRESHRTLVARLMPVVQARVLRRVGRRRGSTEDLVQEVWKALFENRGRKLLAFAPERGATLEGFVGRIAEREVLSIIRSQMARKRGGHLNPVVALEEGSGPAVGVADSSASPEAVAAAADLAARLGEHLAATLPERGLLILRYVFSDGLNPIEAARLLGVKVQVVYNWKHKIRAVAEAFLAG